jgi:Holliday junction resolvasome RuvABC ATP-dependent DNA helicase subunit
MKAYGSSIATGVVNICAGSVALESDTLHARTVPLVLADMDKETPITPTAQGSPPRYGDVLHSQVSGFNELSGQSDCAERLKRFGELYSSKNAVPEHVLLTGDGGMGKRVFAHAFAKTFNVSLHEQEARYVQRKGDLTAILTSLEERDALLIVNLQDLRRPLAEELQVALDNYRIDLVIGEEERVFPFRLNRFTFLGTAPRVSDVPPDLLKCFSLSLTLQPYSSSELQSIAVSLAARTGLTLSEGVLPILVSASQRNPNSIEQLLRRFARLGKTKVTEEDAKETFAAFGLTARQVKGAPGAHELDSLSGIEFEKLILSLLQRMGFHAEMTRTTGDGGIDIVANLDKPIIGGRYLIQCKRFAESLIGAPLVREFYGAVVADRKAVKGILITTSGFTTQAREFVETLPLELIDRDQLTNLLAEFKPED